jgi:hypothetical protein
LDGLVNLCFDFPIKFKHFHTPLVMKTINYSISLFAGCSLILGLAAIRPMPFGLAQTVATPSRLAANEKLQLLFVQTATNGSFDGKTLTLNGLGPTVFFSDRPKRIAGQVRTVEFVNQWGKGGNSFAANPPNATLSIFGTKGVNSAVIELTKPQLAGNTLSYQVKVLKGTLPSSFQESSLFIDTSAGVATNGTTAGASDYYYHSSAPAPANNTPPAIVIPRLTD